MDYGRWTPLAISRQQSAINGQPSTRFTFHVSRFTYRPSSVVYRERDCMSNDADVIVIGAGLAGLVAAAEIADAGKRVIIIEQEPGQSLGGQAFWSLGGLFL